MSSSVFHNLLAQPLSVLELYEECANDTFSQKIDITAGVFFTADSRIWVSPLVRKIEKILAEDKTLVHHYVGVFGSPSFSQAVSRLMLGEENSRIVAKQVFGMQTVGGTGALWLGFVFLNRFLQRNIVYISDPAWENYDIMLEMNGFNEIRKYRYWDAENKCLDFEGMCEDLNNAPENAVILLQACAHNPTGCDPTRQQWMKIGKIIKERKLFPFFDCAYLGLVSGNCDEDAWAVRHFAAEGHEFFCAVSFSKTFAIYGLRTGSLTIVVNDKAKIEAIKTLFMLIIRGSYIVPPSSGSRVVEKALNTPQHLEEWHECIRARYEKLVRTRKTLRERLEAKTQQGQWKCITDQGGLFAYIGLSADAVKILKQKYHIYLLDSGRINMPSLNGKNLDYFVDSLIKTLQEIKTSSCNKI